MPVRILIQSKLHPTIRAKMQHSKNSVCAHNLSIGKAWIMSRISSLKFPILHDIKDTLFGYYFYLNWATNIARTIFNSIKTAHHYHSKTQHSQNSVGAKNSSVGNAWIMSQISSLKFPIIHDIEDNLFGY